MAEATQDYLDVVYARYPSGREMRLNLFVPSDAKGRAPLVIYLRGGGWREVIRTPPLDWLVLPGTATATVDYRGWAEATAPASLHDCKAAVRFLRANADEYGLDPDRIAIMGSSAGGHLAAMVGLTAGVAEFEGDGGNQGVSSAVQAVVDYCGPSDLTRMASPEYRHHFGRLYDVTCGLLGGPVEERMELGRKMSPLYHVKREVPPIFIEHVKGDPVVPSIESVELYQALYSAGADVSLGILEGNTHAWDKAPTFYKVVEWMTRVMGLGR